jgi:hypothetical protein
MYYILLCHAYRIRSRFSHFKPLYRKKSIYSGYVYTLRSLLVHLYANRGTTYNSRSFTGNLLFVGDYDSWCSGRTIFAVSSIMLMWNLVKFYLPWQLLRFLRFSIVIPREYIMGRLRFWCTTVQILNLYGVLIAGFA